MSRAPTSAVSDALAAAHVREIVFAEFDFSDGLLRLCTADHDVDWNGYTWQGAGRVGSLEAVEEGATLEARAIKMTLAGVSAALVSTALGTQIQGRALRLWYGVFDAAAWTLLADPVGPLFYRLDALRLRHGRRGLIEVTARDRLADWDRPRIRRYNNADQVVEFPDDKGFQYAETMVEKTLIW